MSGWMFKRCFKVERWRVIIEWRAYRGYGLQFEFAFRFGRPAR